MASFGATFVDMMSSGPSTLLVVFLLVGVALAGDLVRRRRRVASSAAGSPVAARAALERSSGCVNSANDVGVMLGAAAVEANAAEVSKREREPMGGSTSESATAANESAVGGVHAGAGADDLEVSVPNVYRVARDFQATNSDELDVLEGDIVVVLERFSDGWILANNEGVEGVIPFVVCAPLFAVVVADFAASGDDELSLSAGSRVHVFEYFDDGWALVRPLCDSDAAERAGMIPQDFLDDSVADALVAAQ